MEADANAFSDGPLTGLRVLDLTSVVMGPFATRVLADFGADVIKIESPSGDSLRHHLPARSSGMSGMFLNLNRNKRSVCLDLKSASGKEALRRLIETADVFVHAVRPDAIARLGFGYAEVAAIKPEIIYCGAYGFGADGPYAPKAAYDDVIQAGSGMAGLTAMHGGAPSYYPNVICDKLAGQAIAYSILAAYTKVLRGGGGSNIEVPMFETAIDFNLAEHIGGFAFSPQTEPMGYPRILSKHRKPYATADGYACILPYSTRNWIDFFGFAGRPEVMDDPRFAELSGRVANIDELYSHVADAARLHTTAEWGEFCDARSIPCMPVVALEELKDDPHVAAVGLFEEHEHPTEGRYRIVRSPIRIDERPYRLRRHAPTLGQDTEELLSGDRRAVFRGLPP